MATDTIEVQDNNKRIQEIVFWVGCAQCIVSEATPKTHELCKLRVAVYRHVLKGLLISLGYEPGIPKIIRIVEREKIKQRLMKQKKRAGMVKNIDRIMRWYDVFEAVNWRPALAAEVMETTVTSARRVISDHFRDRLTYTRDDCRKHINPKTKEKKDANRQSRIDDE